MVEDARMAILPKKEYKNKELEASANFGESVI